LIRIPDSSSFGEHPYYVLMARLGTVLLPGPDFQASLKHVQLADELGYDSVWVTNNVTREAFVVLTAYACATKQIGVGTDIVQIQTRHPAVMAQQALSLNDVSGGRFRLGLGVSHAPNIEGAFGLQMGKPLELMREYVQIMRQAFAGAVSHEGQHYRVKWEYTMPRKPPPLYIAGLNPHMLELAGEIADGVLLWLPTPEYVRDTVVPRVRAGRERAGKSLNGFEVICPVPAAIVEDAAAGWQSFRTELVRYSSLPFYQQEFRNAGYGEEVDAFLRDREKGDPAAAVRPRLAEALGAVGSAADVAAMVQRFVAAGVTLPLLRPVHGPAVEATLRNTIGT
jgi:alkanesulfonate monooxygenase SsuD/methylene tetrahydromethanopterin reductase-like flavin-dependent oxidoreductase (luciferase family)